MIEYITFPFEGADKSLFQNGMVKSISDDEHLFIVFNCNGEWNNIQNYTAQRTNIKQIGKDWMWEY